MPQLLIFKNNFAYFTVMVTIKSEIAMAWQYGKPETVIDKLWGISAQLIGKTLYRGLSGGDTRRTIRAENAEEAVSLLKGRL